MSTERTRLVHDALYYGSDQELLAVSVPFLRAGLDAGETVAVACPGRLRDVLGGALSEDPRVHFLGWEAVYQRPARAVTAQREFVAAALATGAGRVRLLGEVRFGEDPAGWGGWAEFESVINLGLGDLPVWGLCLYDTRRLPAPVLAAGRLTHPQLIVGGRRQPNPRYVPPTGYSPARDPDPVQATRPALDIHPVADLRRLRHAVLDTLTATPAAPEVAENFAVAVNEVATNATVHGLPPVRLRLWTGPPRSVCAVTDRGAGVRDRLAGYLPGHGHDLSRRGMGLWLARQLCDDVHLATTADGFTARLTIRH